MGKTGRGACIPNSKACATALKQGVETTIAAGTVAGTAGGAETATGSGSKTEELVNKAISEMGLMKKPRQERFKRAVENLMKDMPPEQAVGVMQQTYNRSNRANLHGKAYTDEEKNAIKDPHMQVLYGIAKGTDTRTRAERESDTAAIEKMSGKVEDLSRPGSTLTGEDSVSLMSNVSYLNEQIRRGKFSDPTGAALSVARANALDKMPVYDGNEVPKRLRRKDGTVVSGFDIPNGDLDSFLSNYENAIGREHKEPTFLRASSTAPKGIGNVQMIVTPRKTNGQAKRVGTPGNIGHNPDVEYGPYSRFKVSRVEKDGKGGATIYMDEL